MHKYKAYLHTLLIGIVFYFRWVRQIQSASYLHNTGSEPLTIATLGDVIAEAVEKYPGRIAVKSLHEGINITYEELLTQAGVSVTYPRFSWPTLTGLFFEGGGR